ncbi:MAG TPA: DUF378 domain-containing protein [Candidatus Nanoarchaeia archaeon]|nr:DUF378 domain-containing protein [Candidatus Nanoarchaeia archaeon]
MAKDMGTLGWIAFVLVIIGAINWGLAVWDINIVASLFGAGTFAKVIYGLIGLSGVWMIYSAFK